MSTFQRVFAIHRREVRWRMSADKVLLRLRIVAQSPAYDLLHLAFVDIDARTESRHELNTGQFGEMPLHYPIPMNTKHILTLATLATLVLAGCGNSESKAADDKPKSDPPVRMVWIP